MTKYRIWNKQDPIVTPSGGYFTAEEYIERFCPAAKAPFLRFVCADEDVNGKFFSEFTVMKEAYAERGAVFADGMTDQEVLDAIAAFEQEAKTRDDEAAVAVTTEERIAAALEFANLLNL